MNRALNLPLVFGLAIAAAIAGCQTTPEQAAYRTIGTTVHVVDGAMKGWGDYVGAGKSTVQQEAQVKGAYLKYQSTMRLTRQVVASIGSQPEGSTIVEKALQTLSEVSGELVVLIREFTAKGPEP